MKEKFDMTISREPSRIVKRRQRRKKAFRRFRLILFVLIGIVGPPIFWGIRFYLSHFNPGTTINGVDCSWLTPEKSYEKLLTELQQTQIIFHLEKSSGFSFASSLINLTFDDNLEEILEKQKKSYTKEFSFSSFSFDEKKLKESLQREIQPEKRFLPEDASTILVDNLLQIVPEKGGNFIPLEEAYELTSNQLKSGNWSVDLTSLIVSKPKVTSADLVENVEEINSILQTSITFDISKNCSLTLDKSVMCNWLVNENGIYRLDVEGNLPKFIERLEEQIKNTPIIPIKFQGTGVGIFTVPCYEDLSLDVEAELAFIQENLGTGETLTHQPIYRQIDTKNYVEVDITRQHVWFYQNGVCIIESDCVTGTANKQDTSRGYFFLEKKIRNKDLKGPGYRTPVAYWMPFNGGEGLHDAYWRIKFGKDIYLTDGSHGCVNLPTEVAKLIFETINLPTPVIVYASS